MQNDQPDGTHQFHSQTASGHETQAMRALRSEVLNTYPAHYGHAVQVMAWNGHLPDQCRCAGAKETELTENGMTVRFDIWTSSNERFLVDVTMSEGVVTDHNIYTLGVQNQQINASAPRLPAQE